MTHLAVSVIVWACGVDGCEPLASSWRYLSVRDPCHARVPVHAQTAGQATVKMR